MGFDAIIRKGISIANTLTASVQAEVVHFSFSSSDAYNKPTFSPAAGTKRKALVESVSTLMRRSNGQEVMSSARVTFLSPVDVDVRDRITLPDATTRNVLDVRGIVDPTTDKLYMVEVILE